MGLFEAWLGRSLTETSAQAKAREVKNRMVDHLGPDMDIKIDSKIVSHSASDRGNDWVCVVLKIGNGEFEVNLPRKTIHRFPVGQIVKWKLEG